MQLKLIHLKERPDKARRYIWGGLRRKRPDLDYIFYYNDNNKRQVTFRQVILEDKMFPVIIVWENQSGERKYCQVNKTK